MKIIKPDKNVLALIQVIIAAFAGASAYMIYTFIPMKNIMLFINVIFIFISAVADFFYLPLWFRKMQIVLGKDGIKKVSGVFFSFERTVNYTSVQFADIISFPFSKHIGLNFIVLNVYGGKMLLPFLKKQDKLYILKYIGRDYC